jgi:hypothetical protein
MADKIDLPPLYRTVPSSNVADRRKKPDEKPNRDRKEAGKPKPDRKKDPSKVDEYV